MRPPRRAARTMAPCASALSSTVPTHARNRNTGQRRCCPGPPMWVIGSSGRHSTKAFGQSDPARPGEDPGFARAR